MAPASQQASVSQQVRLINALMGQKKAPERSKNIEFTHVIVCPQRSAHAAAPPPAYTIR
jgi:hypothetical protein